MDLKRFPGYFLPGYPNFIVTKEKIDRINDNEEEKACLTGRQIRGAYGQRKESIERS